MFRQSSTSRGFGALEFEDDYGEHCTLQESSAVDPHVWLGIDNPDIKIQWKDAKKAGLNLEKDDQNTNENGWCDFPLPEGTMIMSRMRLTREQAGELAKKLKQFADYGTITSREMIKVENYQQMNELKHSLIGEGYEEYDDYLSCNLIEAAKEFMAFVNIHHDKRVFAEFNGCLIFSDEEGLSEDKIVKFVSGMTIDELIEHRKRETEEYERKEKEWKEQIPELANGYIERGHAILKEKYWELWDKIVPICLADLYHGMELNAFFELAEMLNNGKDFNEVNAVFENQNHSGMSYSLMKSMLKAFGYEEFVNSL